LSFPGGCHALSLLTTGQWNTALGAFTLWKNMDASNNTAVGAAALLLNNQFSGAGSNNTAMGAAALLLNSTGEQNVASGAAALESNDSGSSNIGIGAFALFSNTGRVGNVAIGDSAMFNLNGSFNTAVGFGAGNNLTTAGFAENIYIGDTAGTLEFNGNSLGDEGGVIRIGSVFSGTTACYINGILPNFILTAQDNPIVTINTITGQLGWTTDFAAGKVEEQQKKIEEQQASINQLKSEMQTMVAQLKENAVQIQRANTQLEMSNPVTKVVANKR